MRFLFSQIRVVRHGFSLIETIIVVAIFAIIFFGVVGTKNNVDVLNNVVNQKLLSRQDLEQTFQIMANEIRSASVSSLGAYPIEAAASSSFVFYSDTDSDGLFEKVTYAFSGTSTITRTVIKPTGNPLVYATSSQQSSVVVNYASLSTSTPLFSYYDASYTGTQSALSSPIDVTKIRLVKVTLYADVEKKSAPKSILFTDTIMIRSFRNN